jgi:D-3-phosphoglycerate dehydrogenase
VSADSLRVLVVGDPYFQATDFHAALEGLAGRADLSYHQVESSTPAAPISPSEERLREYVGNPREIAALVRGHDVLVVHGASVSEEVLSAPGLRLVCCARGGPVNVDVEAATRLGVPVCNTPGKNAEAVAQLTIAFLLALIRGVVPASRHLAAGSGTEQASVFDGREFFGEESTSLTLGLIGFGLVGRHVARHARELGFRVIAHDPYVRETTVDGVEVVDLATLLSQSHAVSLHARSTAENLHMMGRDQFGAMRPSSYLINTAREQLVDEDALRDALRSGHLAGAALDVVELHAGERNPLLDEPAVLVTPHIGGATLETLRRGADMVASTITALLDGEELPFVVNPDAVRSGFVAGGAR